MTVTPDEMKDLVAKLRLSSTELAATGSASHLLETVATEIEALSAGGDIDKAGERILELWRELRGIDAIGSIFSGVRGVTKAEMPSASLERTAEMVVFVQKLVMDIPKSAHRQVNAADPGPHS